LYAELDKRRLAEAVGSLSTASQRRTEREQHAARVAAALIIRNATRRYLTRQPEVAEYRQLKRSAGIVQRLWRGRCGRRRYRERLAQHKQGGMERVSMAELRNLVPMRVTMVEDAVALIQR
jgi:hypothetical protein